MGVLRDRPRAFVYAVLVHLLLLGVLVFSLDWAPSVKPSASSNPAPVQAVVIDAGKLDAEVQRQKQLEEKKQREAEEKLQRAEQAAREAEQRRKQEEQRVAELKRQEAEQRKQAEAQAKRQAAAAEKQRQEEARRKAEAEKQRQAEEARREAEAEKQRQEEARRKAEAEKQRQEEARRKAEAEKKRQEEARRKAEAEARKAAEAEMQARLAAEQARLASQRQSAMQSMINEYVAYIKEKVERNWIQPPGSSSALSCTVQVRLIPSGEVIDAQIVRSSGDAAFDRSVEAAVFKASPLPVPPDAEVMQRFRSIRFEFKPGSS